MSSRLSIVLALSLFAAPLTAQSASIRASARVLSTPAVVQQAPVLHRVTERVAVSLGIQVADRNDHWVGYDPRMTFAAHARWHVQAIREIDPSATPHEGSELRADSEGLTAWAWTEGAEDRTAHMIIADLTR